jgi:acetate kinase
MKILVANLGSTSFKYKLFTVSPEAMEVLAKGAYERVQDHGKAISEALQSLTSTGVVKDLAEIDGVVFKTVMGGEVSGCREADETVLEALENTADIAPAHNPPYAEGIRQFRRLLPTARRVALFETAFYQWVSPAASAYALPARWRQAGIRRYGFHGASHKFIAERSAQLLGREDVAERVARLYTAPQLLSVAEPPLRVISCHLGGSSSVTGICNGLAIGTSMGLSPQSGLPQNNRVGDLDSMALPVALKRLGLSIDEALTDLTKNSGLLGLSGVSNDVRDITAAAENGNADAQLALDHLVHSIRHWIGAFWIQMGGCEAIVFTAGIGENSCDLRARVCAGLEGIGLTLDTTANDASGPAERLLSTARSATKSFVIPANEEAVLATEAARFLASQN